VEIPDDLLEADLLLEIQTGGAKGLTGESQGRQSVEHIERGHGGAIGEINDRVSGGEDKLAPET
jgi:hypothetical protein